MRGRNADSLIPLVCGCSSNPREPGRLRGNGPGSSSATHPIVRWSSLVFPYYRQTLNCPVSTLHRNVPRPNSTLEDISISIFTGISSSKGGLCFREMRIQDISISKDMNSIEYLRLWTLHLFAVSRDCVKNIHDM